MKPIPDQEILQRLRAENTWWNSGSIGAPEDTYPRREYFKALCALIGEHVQRAILLLGPRRVGKTVILHHVVQDLIERGVPPRTIAYISVDHPAYNDLSLERLIERATDAAGVELRFVLFDEIQYRRNWERELKHLVDDKRAIRIVVSGSAAAALKLKSQESGAGRFTEFLLPPLTFQEFLKLRSVEERLVEPPSEEGGRFRSPNIAELNRCFVEYLNFGGYPEAALSEAIQKDPARYIKSDIVDKVLLRDLPSLYGIQDVQELNSLFTALAYNTAQEVSLEALSKRSGVAKNTLKRYIEYLEAAFLIRVVHRVDQTGKRFQRANAFKVYLTNPSIRSALFSRISEEDEAFGSLVETAVFGQWFHSPQPRSYARWPGGEVDMVSEDWAAEVKWSDRPATHAEELKALAGYCVRNGIKDAFATTRTIARKVTVDGIKIDLVPASLYCYTVGKHILSVRSLCS